MAISSSSSSSSSDNKVQNYSKQCLESFKTLQKNFDSEREKHNRAKLEIQGYELALESLESRILGHEKNEMAWGEKYEFQNYDLKCREIKINNLKTELEKVVKERDELKVKIEKWEESSKSLNKLLNSQMNANDKNGLGYGTQMDEMSNKFETDSEISMSIFEVRSSDEEITSANDRFSKADGYHAVPPPITGNFLTPRADISFAGLDEFAIRKKIIESKTTELKTDTSKSKTSETVGNTNEVNIEKPKSVYESVVSTPNINREKVIIEDWNSDDEDDVSEVIPETQTVKTQVDKIGQISKKEGIGFKKIKACFVCKSTDHLIRDCDFHEKRMAKQVELNKLKGKGTGQGEKRPVWNNVQRLNHQNNFVPKAVLTKTGRFPVNAARQNLSSQATATSTARKVNTARPIVNEIRPRNNFFKSHSPNRRPFNRPTASKANPVKVNGVNTAKGNAVKSDVKGNWENVVKPSARCEWRPINVLDNVSKDSASMILKRVDYIDAHELAIPGQTATGKESSNPFMAGSLPKTIHFCDSLQSDEDSDDASKQGRIDIGDIDTDAEITLIDETQGRINDIIADEDITLIPKLIIKQLKISRNVKFPVAGGILTLKSSKIIPIECAAVSRPEGQPPVVNQVAEERINVAIDLEYPEQTIMIGSTLTKEVRNKLCDLLQRKLDVFAWNPAEMSGVTRNIAEHRLNIREGCPPVRQKRRGQAADRNQAIQEEVEKLVEADFKDLNKACPKDGYPLPEIDWKVESLCAFPFKCFLDAYKGYHQIKMAKEDEEKTTFITSQGIFFYSKMPFGLRNARATYQRLVDKAFYKQIGRNLEVYVDDLVIKSCTEDEIIREIEETFKTLREIN
ncbi:reverse transcriptase domain-containing protein [Tanacetum coccineum]|uniref:Reverse transcriptase domain-containing protein n=1 Tax=Tanacetum coccineum TaxID=301880 RepID=A0ABQ5GVP0_9ASTR